MSEIGVIRLESELFPVAKIHAFGAIANGGTPTSGEENWNGDIPFITPPDLNGLDGKVVTSVGRTITESGLESGSNLVKNGVIISGRAPVGYVGLVTTPSAFNQGCKVICTDQDHRYVAYALAASKSNLQVLANGTTFSEISSTSVANYAIPLPPLETQQRIADYLDRETAEIDAAVADLDRYGALLEKRKKNQINLAFAPIIEAKEVTPLGVFYSISNGDRGENYPKADEITDQGIPFLNAGDIRKGSVSLNAAKFVTREKYDAMGGAKLRAGDILFCLRGSLGKHGVVDFDEGSVASSLCVIRPLDSSAHSSHFLNYFMETTFFAEQILFAENGSAQPNLSGESLARFRIPASPISEQKRILRDLDRGTAEIDALIEESKKLRDLLLKRRSVLITEVVTGRKQV